MDIVFIFFILTNIMKNISKVNQTEVVPEIPFFFR